MASVVAAVHTIAEWTDEAEFRAQPSRLSPSYPFTAGKAPQDGSEFTFACLAAEHLWLGAGCWVDLLLSGPRARGSVFVFVLVNTLFANACNRRSS